MIENIIVDKSFEFTVKIFKLNQRLAAENKEYVLSKQLLRCGTSIGANTEDAVRGITKRECIAKLQISYKEARYSRYWFRLMMETGIISKDSTESLIKDCDELIRIIVAPSKPQKMNSIFFFIPSFSSII